MNMSLLIISVLLGAFGQFFFKSATNAIPYDKPLTQYYTTLALNFRLWLGFGCYGLSFLIWLRILSKYDLSYARPFTALGYIITVLLALFLLDEKVSLFKWIGVMLIAAGIILISISD